MINASSKKAGLPCRNPARTPILAPLTRTLVYFGILVTHSQYFQVHFSTITMDERLCSPLVCDYQAASIKVVLSATYTSRKAIATTPQPHVYPISHQIHMSESYIHKSGHIQNNLYLFPKTVVLVALTRNWCILGSAQLAQMPMCICPHSCLI